MSDFIIQHGVLYHYEGTGADVVIPQGVTHIAYHAFSDCEHVQSITIPQGVTNIERFAFFDCPHLQSITIPESVICIEKDAFPKKTELRKCVLAPASEDGEQCKMLLDALGTVNLAIPFLSEALETNEILLNNLKTRIVNKKFREKFIPILIEENRSEALSKLLSVSKRISAEELDFYITLSEKAPEIRMLLLKQKNKRYPREILEKMRDIQLEKELGLREKTLADYKKIFSVKKENGVYVITKYRADQETVSVPGKINGIPVRIGEKAFYACEHVKDVFLDDGVTEICRHAFAFCTKLQNVYIPESVTNLGNNAFQHCLCLKEILLPNKIKKIGISAFDNCQSLQSILIPDGVTEIGDFAFHSCESLQTITLPKSLKHLGIRAFAYCKSLQSVAFPDSITEIDSQAFAYCKSLKSVTLSKGITAIRNAAFFCCENLTSFFIPDGVTAIESSAFCRCTSLQSIRIPDGLTDIGNSAFFGCISLRSVTVPESVTNIEFFSFFDCKNLTLICYENSFARKYAQEEGIPFQSP